MTTVTNRTRWTEDGSMYELSDQELLLELATGTVKRGENTAYRFVSTIEIAAPVFEAPNNEGFENLLQVELTGAAEDLRRYIVDAHDTYHRQLHKASEPS